MIYKKIDTYIFNCSTCPTRCDGKSKAKYIFQDDVDFAEEQENIIIRKLKDKGYNASKCKKEGYPDIVIKNEKGIASYIEVKAQRRTFMSVRRILPGSNLYPSETVALNLSDLLRYFEIYKKENVPVSLIWVLQNRPCIVNEGQSKYFYQDIEILEKIYLRNKNTRVFRIRSGKGDVVNGVHKGVVVNYHFSLRELKLWDH